MYQDRIVLCASSTYTQKYYLNPDFNNLPQQIQEELQVACILFTEQISCVFQIEYNEDGSLEFVVIPEKDDFAFDEIGSGLKIKELQMSKRDLWETLELYFRVFFLGEDL